MIQKKVRIELGTSGAESTHLNFWKKKNHTHMKKKSVLARFELVTSGAESKHLWCFLLTTLYLYCTSKYVPAPDKDIPQQCGELKLYFSPSAGGWKKKKKKPQPKHDFYTIKRGFGSCWPQEYVRVSHQSLCTTLHMF